MFTWREEVLEKRQYLRTHVRIVPGMEGANVGAEGEDSSMGINLAAGENPSAIVESDDEAEYLGVYQQSASSMDVYPEKNMMFPTIVPSGMNFMSFGGHTNGTFNYAPFATHNCEVEIATSGV
jgi:hypothetical protein